MSIFAGRRFNSVDMDNPFIVLEEKLSQVIDQQSQILEQLKFVASKDRETKLLTRQEVCERLSITFPTLKQYTLQGIIPGYRVGRRILYREEDIEACLERLPSIKFTRNR